MKRFERTMKTVVAMLSFCLVFVLSITSEAAKYQPNVTYIDPQVDSKDQYYSTTKMRMSTYEDRIVRVIYPKDAKIAVSTSKKDLQAMITYKCNELNPHATGKKVYVVPNGKSIYDYEEYETLYLDKDNNRLYYNTSQYDDVTGKYIETKVYPSSMRVYMKLAGNDDYYRYYLYYDETQKTYYVYDYDEDLEESVKKNISLDWLEWDCYYTDDKGNRKSLDKDNLGYYYRDYSVTVYENEQTVRYDDGKTPDYEYAVADIQLTSTKKGTYKLYVTVNGKKSTLTVYVNPYGDRTYTSVKLDKNTVKSVNLKETANDYTYTEIEDYQVKNTLKTAKLSLKANKGIKITGVVTAYLDKDGKACYKKTKNNKKINLSQAYDYSYNYVGKGSYTSKSANRKTFLFISYQDSYLKTSYTYSVVTKHGVKQVKEVYKAANGKSYTRYYDYGEYGNNKVASSVITLWSN